MNDVIDNSYDEKQLLGLFYCCFCSIIGLTSSRECFYSECQISHYWCSNIIQILVILCGSSLNCLTVWPGPMSVGYN